MFFLGCEPFTASPWPKHIPYLLAKASRATVHCPIGSCGCCAQLWLIWHVRGLHPRSYLGIDCSAIVHANHSFSCPPLHSGTAIWA